MSKIRQRNWLIVITVLLVVVSGIGFFLSIHQQLSFPSCAYDGEIYRNGEDVPNYNGKDGCSCNSSGTIVCKEEIGNNETGLSDFSSSNLQFTYRFLNLLSKDITMREDVETSSASYINNTLSLTIERNVLCSNDNEAPVQTGFYKLSDSELKLVILTSTDAAKYTLPCRTEAKFVISNVNISLSDNFQMYYQSEGGLTTNLGSCVYNGILYGSQEAFKSQDLQSVCLCNSGKITCRALQ